MFVQWCHVVFFYFWVGFGFASRTRRTLCWRKERLYSSCHHHSDRNYKRDMSFSEVTTVASFAPGSAVHLNNIGPGTNGIYVDLVYGNSIHSYRSLHILLLQPFAFLKCAVTYVILLIVTFTVDFFTDFSSYFLEASDSIRSFKFLPFFLHLKYFQNLDCNNVKIVRLSSYWISISHWIGHDLAFI